MIILDTPTKARLIGYESRLDLLKLHLKYIDRRYDFEAIKFKEKRSFWVFKYGLEYYEERLKEYKELRNQSLLFEENGEYWTYSGVAQQLANDFSDKVQINFNYPESKNIPWAHVPEHELRPYQKEALEALLKHKHASVSMATGVGKSFVILHIVKRLGLKSLIVAPSISIAKQLYNDFIYHFGKKYVGQFFGTKKESAKTFIIAVAQSLIKVEPDSEHYKNFNEIQILGTDESHHIAATALSKISLDLCKNAPYRFFLSATQFRNDGIDLLLKGITGPVVMHYDLQQGVKDGYLAEPIFKLIRINSNLSNNIKDVNANTRAHLFYNPKINKVAGEMANKLYEQSQRPVLILIDEIEQFAHLLPHFKHPCKFAYGGLTAKNLQFVPKEYQKDDAMDLVKQFNDYKIPILVGTTCISEGTDIKPVHAIIYLQGGKSGISVRQAVGRGTRMVPGKKSFYFIDFDVVNINPLHRHANERIAIYNDIYPALSFIDIL